MSYLRGGLVELLSDIQIFAIALGAVRTLEEEFQNGGIS